MAFNMEAFRTNKMKMTQEEFGRLLGIPQDKVSRLERGNPDDIPFGIITTIAEKSGMTVDEVIDYKKPVPKPLVPNDTWGTEALTARKTIVHYLDDGKNYISRNDKKEYTDYEQASKLFAEFDTIVKTDIKKYRIAFVGRSDAGKSTMINALVGTEKMPVAWTPLTAIPVYLRHIADRPAFVGNAEVVVYKAPTFEEAKNGLMLSCLDGSITTDLPNAEKRTTEFKPEYLDNEAVYNNLKLESGSAELLKKYGVRHDEESAEISNVDIAAAVIYLDAPILKDVDIVDLPGFGTGDGEIGERDNRFTQEASKYMDVLVYLSPSNGFLQDGDIDCLRLKIPELPIIESKKGNNIKPLNNLYIVASQAHIVGNQGELTEILNKGCNRFTKVLPDTVSSFFLERSNKSGYDITKETLQSRFFTYSTDTEDSRKVFEDDLRNLIENLPRHAILQAEEHLQTYAEERGIDVENDIKSYNSLLENYAQNVELLKNIEANEDSRKTAEKEFRESIHADIALFARSSEEDFKQKYNSIINVDNIVAIIKTKDFKKRKQDIELLCSHISGVLEQQISGVLNTYSEKLKHHVDDYISDFEQQCQKSAGIDVKFSIPFNAKRAFASGFVGLGTLAGLSAWAAALGNLGGYILVAKGVSLLSALGISISGGTAAAISAVASIGGPIMLGIALALLAAFSMFALLSGGWQKELAKKLIKAYEKENVLEKYNAVISDYWNDTKFAFDKAANAMEESWQDEIAKKRRLVEENDTDKLQNSIKEAENFKNFLAGIPSMLASLRK